MSATEYRIEWSIELHADSHEDAARRALAIQRDPESMATVFHVTDGDEIRVIDITLIDERRK